MSAAGLWDAVDLPRVFDQERVRHVDGELDRGLGLPREAVMGVIEGADMTLAAAVSEVFAENMDRIVAYDSERVGEKPFPVVDGKPFDAAVGIVSRPKQSSGTDRN